MQRRKSPRPPALAALLIRFTAPATDVDVMLGDLEEEFHRRAATHPSEARFWFWQQALRSAPVNTVRKLRDSFGPRTEQPGIHLSKGDDLMTTLLHDFRFAWRSVIRNKRLAATIIGTLALGIAATTVIFSVIDGVVL
ncbi:MAG: hypothetical protein ABI672_11725, partial [Vicinamibacteria bacterium]